MLDPGLPETKRLSIPKKTPDASFSTPLLPSQSRSGLGERAREPGRRSHSQAASVLQAALCLGPATPAFDFHYWGEMSKKSDTVLSLRQTPFSLATRLAFGGPYLCHRQLTRPAGFRRQGGLPPSPPYEVWQQLAGTELVGSKLAPFGVV